MHSGMQMPATADRHSGASIFSPSQIRAYFQKPNRIWADGPSKYFFYDHTKSGAEAVNPVSRFVESAISDYLKCRPSTSSKLSQNLLTKLQSDGIVVFPLSDLEGGGELFKDLLTEMQGEIAKLKRDIDRWLEQLRNPSAAEKVKDYLFRIAAPSSLASACWRLAINPEILSVVNDYMHAHAKIQSMQYWINAPRPGQAPKASQLWHRDGDGTCIKLFVYISDVGENSGPFSYACGTHQGEKRSTHGKKRMEDAQLLDLFHNDVAVRDVTGRAGTAILANTCGYHKGGFVREQIRHILHVAYFCPWIDRSDYKLVLPKGLPDSLHPAQRAAIRGRDRVGL